MDEVDQWEILMSASGDNQDGKVFLQSQRLEMAGALAGGLAHDLNNVLAPSLLTANLLRSKLSTEDEWLVTSLEDSMKQGMSLLKELVSLLRRPVGTRTELRPRLLIRTLEKLIRGTFPPGIKIHTEYPETLPRIQGDATQLLQLLLNLCLEARDRMGGAGQLEIHAAEMGGRLRIELVHTVAMASQGPRLTLDPPAAGDSEGLRAQVVERILTAHDGCLERVIEEAAGRMTVLLPADSMAFSSPALLEPEVGWSGDGALALVVEDDAAVRQAAEATLKNIGYRVMTAENGREAMNKFHAAQSMVRLVLTDVFLEDTDGPTLLNHLRRLQPHLAVIVMTGASFADDLPFLQGEAQTILTKPFSSRDLLRALAEAGIGSPVG